MSKEVEDALHMLLHCSLKDTEYETQFKQYKIVRKYITNLQQKNKQLKEEKRKVKKYIKEHKDENDYVFLLPSELQVILSILGEKE